MINPDVESSSDLFTESENSENSESENYKSEAKSEVESEVENKQHPTISKEIKKMMLQDRIYPSPEQKDLQFVLYKKRDLTIHKYSKRAKIETKEQLKEFRELICGKKEFKLQEHQALLSNFINPNTPYKGLLVFHGTGSGKTCASIAIAEKFKPMVDKYGTKIHVLVPGPLLKQNFLNEIINCTGNTYLEIFQDKTMVMSDEELIKAKKLAINIISQYYRIMTHRSFYKKVLGEKIREKVVTSSKTVKATARKTETGEYEREASIDRIYSLDNTLLIIDEAHAVTGNEYGDAVKKIIQNSKQLKIILLTATPMKNLADDIIELLNYIRPLNYPMERDKIFTSARGNTMAFKPDGKEYLRNMSRGYVSYLRGADPLTYAERIEVGEIPPGLDFTKVTRCYMEEFQLKTYNYVIETFDDALNRISEAVANFVFPGIKKVKETYEIEALYGVDGLAKLKSQLKTNYVIINKKIATDILKLSSKDAIESTNWLQLDDEGKIITGDIFKIPYLQYFSIKFYRTLQDINENVWGKRGAGLLFVYSNLVRSGIELFRQVMLQNGYLEYEEDANNYTIKPDTKCYFCGHGYSEHPVNSVQNVPPHKYFPAVFLYVTGQSEESPEQVPEETMLIINKVFKNINNKDGKNIKLILGSKVMNEGISLRNIREIFIVDVHHSLGKVDQAMGRGIRWCVHYDITTDENPFPKVYIHKYVISLKDGAMSSEEDLYKKAEQKYRLIKETERILQEEAIDCPLNYNGNVFPEEIEKYKNCGTKENPCPGVCGYISCDFKCADKLLDAEYYDPERHIYRTVAKADLDYSTYDINLANEEINYTKDKIKDMYKLDSVYVLSDIVSYVKSSFPVDKRDIFDEYYVYRALFDLLPITTNDFNNFKDVITDKYNRQGYLIYRNKYYIFNQFDENEDVPMYYRRNYSRNLYHNISLNDYINHTLDISKYIETEEGIEGFESTKKHNFEPEKEYDFNSVIEYYDNKEDYKHVGILDQDSKRTKEEFKLRIGKPKVSAKKRETGMPTFKGAVCTTAKDKKHLVKIATQIKISMKNVGKKTEICELIRDKLFDMEKYSTIADKNKFTYFIIPANHPIYSFPLNLEDKIKMLISSLEKETRNKINVNIKKESIKGRFPDVSYVKYILEFNGIGDNFKGIMESHGAKLKGKQWIIIIE